MKGQALDIQVRRLETTIDWIAAFPIMQQLRPHLGEAEYLGLVSHQQQFEAYCLLGGFAQGVLLAVAGFRIVSSLVYGKHVYVDDLVCDAGHRSSGLGSALLKWIEDHARSLSCKTVVLDSGVQRHGAHRFYLRERMDITAYHFVKAL